MELICWLIVLEIDNNVEEEEKKNLNNILSPFSWVYVRMRMLSLRPELVLAEECQPKCIRIYKKAEGLRRVRKVQGTKGEKKKEII